MKGVSYMSDSSRKRFATTIDEDILQDFKVACVKKQTRYERGFRDINASLCRRCY